jgi:hypothetical protein
LVLSIKQEQNFVGVYEVGKKFWRGKKAGSLLVNGHLLIVIDHDGGAFAGSRYYLGSGGTYVKS